MKIIYGINGYGRGHVTRALGILPELLKDNEVLIFGGGHAYDFLSKKYNVKKIPSLKRFYREGESYHSITLTIKENLPQLMELLTWEGPTFQDFDKLFQDFHPDVVISDFEHWTRRVAKKYKIPLISFDHAGIIAYCDLDLPENYQLQKNLAGFIYRLFLGEADKIIISSFYDAKSHDKRVSVVGPILRSEVKAAKEKDGEHILVYFNKGEAFTEKLEECLVNTNLPIRVYGVNKKDHDNIKFCKLDSKKFIKDLASCRAVVSRGGNQLFGETNWLHKPVFIFPEDSIEQRINAQFVEKMGIGMQMDLENVSDDSFRKFFEKEKTFKKNTYKYDKDSLEEVNEMINEFLDEIKD